MINSCCSKLKFNRIINFYQVLDEIILIQTKQNLDAPILTPIKIIFPSSSIFYDIL